MYDTQLTDEQRKAFAELVKEAQRKFEQDFDSHLRDLKRQFAPKVEERSRVRQLMEDIRGLRGKLAEAADNLRKLGFRVVDDGLISIDYDVDRHTLREFDARIAEVAQDRDNALARFRKALFDLWSSRTVEEARRIVEQLVS